MTIFCMGSQWLREGHVLPLLQLHNECPPLLCSCFFSFPVSSLLAEDPLASASPSLIDRPLCSFLQTFFFPCLFGLLLQVGHNHLNCFFSVFISQCLLFLPLPLLVNLKYSHQNICRQLGQDRRGRNVSSWPCILKQLESIGGPDAKESSYSGT